MHKRQICSRLGVLSMHTSHPFGDDAWRVRLAALMSCRLPVLSVFPRPGNESRCCLDHRKSKDECADDDMRKQQVRGWLRLLPGHNPESSPHNDDDCSGNLHTNRILVSSSAWPVFECPNHAVHKQQVWGRLQLLPGHNAKSSSHYDDIAAAGLHHICCAFNTPKP